jgi:hypothetical protein
MIESLNIALPIFVNVLLIILLVIGIIFVIKLIIVIDKVNEITDNVSEKVKSLDNIFRLFNGISDKFGLLTSKIVDSFISLFSKISPKKRKEDIEDYE